MALHISETMKNWAQLSFLHVYHHANINMVWGYLLRMVSAVEPSVMGLGPFLDTRGHVFELPLDFVGPQESFQEVHQPTLGPCGVGR